MDEHLASYILSYYNHLLTSEERATIQNFGRQWKSEHRSIFESAADKIAVDAKLRALFAESVRPFNERLCERVLREHLEELLLNYCPRCGALAKTPTAKQCHKCFFSWHEKAQQKDGANSQEVGCVERRSGVKAKNSR